MEIKWKANTEKYSFATQMTSIFASFNILTIIELSRGNAVNDYRL